MPANDLVSVVMPARNAERFLRSALASVTAQTHSNIEIILVDDHSTDRTWEIAEGAARQDARIRLFRAETRGVSAARNLGIAQARGALIAPKDADDLWHPEKLRRQVEALDRAPASVGLVYCWSAAVDEDGNILAPRWSTSTMQGRVLETMIAFSLVGNGSTPLIRREHLEAVGGYDTGLTLGEDWKLYIALAEVCEFAVVPEVLTGYRFSESTASLDFGNMEQSVDEVTAWIRARWPQLSPELLRLREFNVNGYLALLAIRQHHYWTAIRYRLRALRARPRHILTRVWPEFWLLWSAHLVGLRVYAWDFWKRQGPFSTPVPFLQAAAERQADQSIQQHGRPAEP